jgi:polyhydroxybutyrate depolymerase
LDRIVIAGRPTRIATAPVHRAPALVVLHGTGGAVDWVDSELRLAALAERHQFTLSYPQGLPPDPAKPPGFLSNPYRWNDGSTRPGDPLHSTPDDIAFLDSLFDDLVIRFSADPNRLYLAGFSNGAGMTYRFAAEGRTRLAGIAPIAGHCWVDPPRLRQPIPTVAMIGDRDPLIPVTGGPVLLPWGQRIVERPTIRASWSKWANAMGHEAVPIETKAEHGLTLDYPGPGSFRGLVIAGLGHHWPGGAGQLNPRLGGPKLSALNANIHLLEEFGLARRP